jgi:limonene-1,2-epoxide hydrolase
MASPAENTVTEFCNAWARLDVNAIVDFFTEDAVYHNIPMPAAKGNSKFFTQPPMVTLCSTSGLIPSRQAARKSHCR